MSDMWRPAAVAGLFYPEEQAELERLVRAMLASAEDCPVLPRRMRALVVPHAGLVYSGPVAATAYHLLQQAQAVHGWSRIVLLGPNHRMPLEGMALAGEADWKTPLGIGWLDRAFMIRLSEVFGLVASPEAHRLEHSLEVQLPFLQVVAEGCRLVPILVGQTPANKVAELIEYCWQDEQTLVIVSSDLSHYHPWVEARRLDAMTSHMIVQADPQLGSGQACGCYALNGLLLAAKRQGAAIDCLQYMTSGDVTGDKEQVVGYGAYVCY
ncbi:AmmeMemoRadiSam system protein B [Marinobacterium marinum]|uniref:MEMO1 family protein H1S06_05830 n=1 Tax=Marinobacterium marinum TaxID=2756129 RepID=A0A7W2ABV8_9GAMM|nr:AmmeMemoRadiSam system protein B [Marinobacterium marinum]MBA4501882.1 AmmeMemoRadiSam system protein B [Marinobacterium marinum]